MSILSFKTGSFDDKKKETVMDRSSGRNMMMEGSQSAHTHVGNLVGLEGVEKEKEIPVEDYEEIFFNTPFAMEYNMSYSMVTQTSM